LGFSVGGMCGGPPYSQGARTFADGAGVGRALEGPPVPEGERVSTWEVGGRERERDVRLRKNVIKIRNAREKEGGKEGRREGERKGRRVGWEVHLDVQRAEGRNLKCLFGK